MNLAASPGAALDSTVRKNPVKSAIGCPRDFLGNRFVYVVVSARARGLSIGINMNPDQRCNFDCVYCEVDRGRPLVETELDLQIMTEELRRTLELVRSGHLRDRDGFRGISAELMTLRHLALSGDGEPTLCPNFPEIVQAAIHVRACGPSGFFKLVLITNGTGLDFRPVQDSLRYFTREDEIWIKLDAGTQNYMDKVNRSKAPLEKVISNILLVGRQRPVVLQSLFPMIDGKEPAAEEINEYVLRLKDLKDAGAQISLVQIYSATRPTAHMECTHLPLKTLSRIAQRVKLETGLKAEVF
ncbi:MAG TPA: radical SAM protein [Verrucomicrobiae bacterium]|jgi:wyosine [tRNA(Phe)-imidazoG37] synthetase (radical SAM superfamily)|nr:radical SAM protein [Verrucomicrobiae bacterium]